jgi:hypothetical protein
MKAYKNLNWWYWAATAVCLAVGLSVSRIGLCFAGNLALIQVVHFAIKYRSIKAFAVQHRLAYLGVIAAGMLPHMSFLYWMALAGTTLAVVTGYCPMARTLSLFSWNRSQPLTLGLVRRMYTTPPIKGSSMHVLTELPANPDAMCRLEKRPNQTKHRVTKLLTDTNRKMSVAALDAVTMGIGSFNSVYAHPVM